MWQVIVISIYLLHGMIAVFALYVILMTLFPICKLPER